MNTFEEKVQEYICRHGLLEPGCMVLVAVSGGADSVALLRVLLALGYDCRVAHCNFHLRGDESNRDENFVYDLCERLQLLQFYCTDFNVEAYKREHGVSTEMACRELRYEWFNSQICLLGAQCVAVAHHSDDNVETMLLNMLRGSGITGLSGIKPRSGKVVRPLLGVTRAEVLAYLDEIGQDYITDSTNLECDYARNKIRNILLPEINRLFPSGIAGLERSLANLQGDYAVWRSAVDEFRRDAVEDGSSFCLRIDRSKLEATAEPVTYLNALLSRYGFNGEQVSAVASTSRVGAVFESAGYVAEVGREYIEVFRNNIDDYVGCEYTLADVAMMEEDWCIRMDIVDYTPGFVFEKNKNLAYFDADAIGCRFTVRRWRRGDRFRPFGMKGSKKLSDYFSDHWFSLLQKLTTPIVEARGRIVWIAGERAADDFRVTPATHRVLVMRLVSDENKYASAIVAEA